MRSTSAARRIVLHEVPRQLGGDEPRRRRMAHEDVDDALAVALAAARRNHLAEHALGARIVGARPEDDRRRPRAAGRSSIR